MVTTDPECTVREAANLLRGCGIDAVPIVERERLIGIVTTTDMLELLGKGSERPLHDRARRDLRDRGPARILKTVPKTKRRAERETSR